MRVLMLMNVAVTVVVVKTRGRYNEQMTRYTNLVESRCSSRLLTLGGVPHV